MPDLSQLVTRIASALQINQTEASQLARRIIPVITVENLDQIGEGAELATRYAIRGGVMVATAGNFSKVGLANPPNSGVRLILDTMMVSVTSSQLMSAGLVTGNPGTLAQGRWRDGGPGVPAGLVSTRVTAGVTTDDITWYPNARAPVGRTSDVFDAMRIVIDPNTSWITECNTANTELRSFFLWKEIKLPTLV